MYSPDVLPPPQGIAAEFFHKVRLWFEGSIDLQYAAVPDEEKPAIRQTMLELIQEMGYTPETSILVNPFPGAKPLIRMLDADEHIRTLEGTICPQVFSYSETQKYDDTNVLAVEGLFTFADYLLLMKPGDCFALLIAAKTKRGPCCGIVHAGRRPVVVGASEAWIQPLIEMCESPDDIDVTITPGLQASHHTLSLDYVDHITGLTCEEHQERFGTFAWKTGDKIHLDIEGYMTAKLREAGIHNIHSSGLDTYELHEQGRGSSRRYATEHGIMRRTGNMCAIHFAH